MNNGTLKKRVRKLTCMALAWVLPLCLFAPTALAEEIAGEMGAPTQELTEEAAVPAQDDVALTTQDDATALAAQNDSSTMPTKFDLRNVDTDGDGVGDRCYVTPVRCQYPFGTCWGFAATAAAETSILSTKFADDPDAWKTLDLSEKQLAFFSHWHVTDTTSPQFGEGTYPTEENPTWDDIYAGGQVYLAAHTYAAGMGPVLESRDEALEYHGANKNIGAHPNNGAKTYAIDDDWELSEDYRFMSDYLLKESYLLPTPSGADESYKYRYDQEATNIIKSYLLNLNAVTIGFCADTSRPWEAVDPIGNYMSTETWAHYTWENALPNHAVVIVGWDDDYPAANFDNKTHTKPPANGAWLVKNSWGAGTNEFPNKGMGTWGIPVTDDKGNVVLDENGKPIGSGYFWLSYYDRSITTPEVLIFDDIVTMTRNSPYDASTLHRDQYDLMPASGTEVKLLDGQTKSANVFTSENGEHLMTISYEVAKPNTEVSYEIYLLANNHASPEDGLLVASGSQTYQYAGYYMTYPDTAPIIVQPGQSYSIVVTQRIVGDGGDAGKYAVNMPQAMGKDSALASIFKSPTFGAAVVNEGESFLYQNGAWADWSNKDLRNSFVPDIKANPFVPMDISAEDQDVQFDNFPIKGFAFDAPINNWQANVRIAGGDAVTVCKDTTKTVAYEFFGEDAEQVATLGLKVTWGLVDTTVDCVEVVPQDNGNAQLVWKKPGTARVYVTVDGIGTVIATVTATDAEHAWSEPAYAWSDDLARCTASRTCSVCGEGETETVDTTSAVTKQPTEAAEGVRTHTATFTNPAFATQTKDEAIPKLEPTPSDDGSKDEPTPQPQPQPTPEPTDGTKGNPQPTPSQGTAKGAKLPATDDPVQTMPLAATLLLSAAAFAVAACLRRHSSTLS